MHTSDIQAMKWIEMAEFELELYKLNMVNAMLSNLSPNST